MVIECCFVDLWGVVVRLIFSKDIKKKSVEIETLGKPLS